MTAINQLRLLGTRRFWPLFSTQFFGAFNDSVFKNALIVLITYRFAHDSHHAQMLIPLVAAVFVLPFFLFSGTAGQLADKYDKAFLIRLTKISELGLMVLTMFAFLNQSLVMLIFLLFCMSTQSTFFGPMKYSILPQHLKESELIGGNALIEATTFIAILIGTIVGGLLILTPDGSLNISIVIIAVALLGLGTSLLIPRAPSQTPDLNISINIPKVSAKIIKETHTNKTVFNAVLGISWFWLIGSVFLAQLPLYTKNTLHADEQVATFFLALFSIGIGIGSMACNRLLKSKISARYTPPALIAMSLFIVDLYLQTRLPVHAHTDALLSLHSFLKNPHHLRISLDFLGIAAAAGIYTVPLYSIVQSHAAAHFRSRTIASNNIMNAAFMVVGSLWTMALIELHFTMPAIFLTLAIGNIFAIFHLRKLLDRPMALFVLNRLIRLAYRVKIEGMDNYRKAGDKVVIIANHTSFLDVPILGTMFPERQLFAVNTRIAKETWIKPFLLLAKTFIVDPTKPMMLKSLIKEIRKGQKCVIFPEGRITITGNIMKIYEGPAMVAQYAGATLLPICIKGAHHSPFSRLRGKFKIRLFPKITATIHAPIEVNKLNRSEMANEIYDIMTGMVFETSQTDQDLFSALKSAMRLRGKRRIIFEDHQRKPIHYQHFLRACRALRKPLLNHRHGTAPIAVLLEHNIRSFTLIFSMIMNGLTPALIPELDDPEAIKAACTLVGATTLITDRALSLPPTNINIVSHNTLHNKKGSTLLSRTPTPDPANIAVILFTQQENTLRAVALTHTNIMANIHQFVTRLDVNRRDIFINPLPFSDAFGLIIGTLLPLLRGVRTFLYTSPTHTKVIPELAYDIEATVLISTTEHCSDYANAAHHYDFNTIRYALCYGSMPIDDDLWLTKFGIRPLSVFGTPEITAVLSLNTPLYYQAGTYGRVLPGMSLTANKSIEVTGPNIAKGYYAPSQPGILQPFNETWQLACSITDQGFVKIEDGIHS